MALDFVAGCVGGAAGVLVGHPLDTVKVHMQVQSTSKVGTWTCLKNLVKSDGFKGLYRGVSSPLVSIAGINAIVFGVYGVVVRNHDNPESLRAITVAGATSGLFQTIFASPMELIKLRMQVAERISGLDLVKKIYLQEGFKGIYRGLNGTIAREVPAFASYFLAYELLTQTKNKEEPLSTSRMLLAGGLAGTLSWLIVYPLDVLKSRVQVDNTYRGMLDCLRRTLKTPGGASSLFQGLTPTLLRAFPVNAVTFTVVTWTIRLLDAQPPLAQTWNLTTKEPNLL